MEVWSDVRPEGALAIENELTQALVLELDRVALRGSGVAPEPRGVRNQAGVEVQSLGVNGLAVSNFDPLVRAVGGLHEGQRHRKCGTADVGACHFSRTRRTTDARSPLPDGFRELASAQIPDNIVQGTSADTSEVHVGERSKLLIGVRPTIGVQSRRLIERLRRTCRLACSRGCAPTWRSGTVVTGARG